MRKIKQAATMGIVGAALLALGGVGGWWWTRHGESPAPTAHGGEAASASAKQDKAKALYWYDPMYPQQHFDKPGKSPFMDMELVPKYAQEAGAASGVQIDPSVAQNLGMRLAKVERIPLATQIEATGIIGFNERNVAVVQSRTGGFVERVWPLAPGDVIKAKQPLVELLVPEWAAAQDELLAVRSSGDAALLAAARDRLRLLGMPERLIHEVEQRGKAQPRYAIVAPIGGVIQSLDVRAGMTVAAGQTLARINGLATVWLEAAVPEAMAGMVRVGDAAEVQLAGFSGQSVNGRVTTILPALNEASRSLRVRIEFPNPGDRLRPGLSAQVKLGGATKETALAVPTEAVIRTGKRTLVMVAGDKGRFSPVEVNAGSEIGDRTVILSGLSEGQEIVASGQFLIDSEASLSGIAARAPEPAVSEAPMTLHEADAKIVALAPGQVTLKHGPFKTLNMPGMTMDFPLVRPELAQGLHVGDKVRVGVRETDDGLVVERLEKAGGAP